MKRYSEAYLEEWKDRSTHKPLVLRGARQVGKTHLVESFAENHFNNCLKVDFELDEDASLIFKAKDPQQVLNELYQRYGISLKAGQDLLFLDEIQNCPEALAGLRYFYEKMPELHVIAAGSLLDFALKEFQYSMPVGRIEFMYLHPLSFEEFLSCLAPQWAEFLQAYTLETTISEAAHKKLLEWLRLYFLIGGMPEAVQAYADTQELADVQRVHHSILETMQNDFAKYSTRTQQGHLRKVFRYVPRNLGQKVRYVKIDSETRSAPLKEALERLSLARIVHLVYHSHSNGIPLDGEVSEKAFKALFLDIGLANHACGVFTSTLQDITTVYEGGLAEQYIGQELLCRTPYYLEHPLFYWLRESKNANAEIDYVVSHENQIVPIEVKAGKTGSLRSLHVFLYEKQRSYAVRFNTDLPSQAALENKLSFRDREASVTYNLLSLPLYLSSQLFSL